MYNTITYFELPDAGRITLPIENGFSYLKYEDIIWCKKEDRNSTQVYLTDNSTVETSWPLILLETCLPHLHFYRVHPLYLINVGHVDQWIKDEKDYLIMTGGTKLPFYPDIRKDFIARIQYAISESIH